MRLGDCCKTNLHTYSEKEKWSLIRYLDTGNITEGRIDEIQTLYPGVDKIPSRARRKVSVGDILFSTVRPNQRHFGIIEADTENLLVSTGFAVVTVDTAIADPYFIYYYLTQSSVIESLQAIAEQSTSTYPSIKPSDIEDIELDLPELETQKKIGSTLRMLDGKRALNEKINDNLLEQLDALYQELSNRDAWYNIAIGELAEKIAMGPFGSNIKVSTFVPYGVPIISGNHLRGYFLEEPNYNYITEEHAEKLKNSIVYPGDIVFTHAGNIGQVAMIPEGCDYPKYVLSQRQFYLRCNKEKILPEYVTLFFHSAEGQHELLSYANQTGVPSLAQPASNLKKIALPVPPIRDQEEWAILVRPIIAYYQRNRLESRSLAALRDTLLPKLMSGEIDVSNIQL